MPTPRSGSAISRRSLLAGATTLPAACLATGLPAVAGAAGEGLGGGTLRVGVIGCGGRGTGAAIQAALADPAVRVVALADLYDDQVASSAEVLGRALGDRFVATADRCRAGAGAALDLVGAGVDMVILAGPPSTRPAHLEAAVAAGAHVWCETPAAVDAAGLARFAGALDSAEVKGLVVASGLCSRHSPPIVGTIERVLDGAVGSIRSITLHHDGGLPWRKPVPATASAEERIERNWISHGSRSGGHFVEHHVHALDRALWLLGDDEPVAIENAGHDRVPVDGIGDVPAGLRVRYRFASGAVVDASCRRSAASGAGCTERVVGSRGWADLLDGRVQTTGGVSWRAEALVPGEAGGMYRSAMNAFLQAIRSAGADSGATARGTTLGGRRLLRATGLAVMGRMAAEGRPVAWTRIVSPSPTA